MDGPTCILSYIDAIYISAMFTGFPDDILKEKPSFLDFEKKTDHGRTDGRTDRRMEETDRRMDGQTDGHSYTWTHLKINDSGLLN